MVQKEWKIWNLKLIIHFLEQKYLLCLMLPYSFGAITVSTQRIGTTDWFLSSFYWRGFRK